MTNALDEGGSGFECRASVAA